MLDPARLEMPAPKLLAACNAKETVVLRKPSSNRNGICACGDAEGTCRALAACAHRCLNCPHSPRTIPHPQILPDRPGFECAHTDTPPDWADSNCLNSNCRDSNFRKAACAGNSAVGNRAGTGVTDHMTFSLLLQPPYAGGRLLLCFQGALRSHRIDENAEIWYTEQERQFAAQAARWRFTCGYFSGAK